MRNREEEEALIAELAEDFAPVKKEEGRTARDERIIAGFEDIQRFVREQGRLPANTTGGDIFERLYAVRLDALRRNEKCRQLLQAWDSDGLLQGNASAIKTLTDEELLSELSDMLPDAKDNITCLTHVRPYHAPEFIAERQPCRDFDLFAPLFAAVRQDLQNGVRAAKPFKKDSGIRVRIEQGDFFILSGQMAYVAAIGDTFKNQSGYEDARLRVVFDNQTESAMLRRSLQRALYKDDSGRRIAVRQDDGALFGDSAEDKDVASGTIYVLRSLSEDPYIAQNRELVHKIGVTGGDVKTRIAHAGHDATFLLADVEIVAEYKLANINPMRLEKLLHQVFAAAQLDITIADRFGNPVQPKEWFLVPLPMINEAVQRIRDGSITEVRYKPEIAAFV